MKKPVGDFQVEQFHKTKQQRRLVAISIKHRRNSEQLKISIFKTTILDILNSSCLIMCFQNIRYFLEYLRAYLICDGSTYESRKKM